MKFFILAVTLAVASAGIVDVGLKNKVTRGELTEAIIELPQFTQQIKNNAALQSLRGDAKVEALVATLQGLTKAAQAPYLQVVKSLGLTYVDNWISNVFLVKGLTAETLEKLAAMEGDFIIREEGKASIAPSVRATEVNITQGPQWGVRMVDAPSAWAVGEEGEGAIAMIIDTGVNLGHVALQNQYAGAWDDPYYSTAAPTDQHGHGSHCAGTILGSANGVGVAPKARWTACRGLNHQGSGSEANLNRCAQFALTGSPRPTVVSNSWGGGSGSTWYDSAVNNWREAGIIPVFALGNSGSSCRTANSPGDRPNLIGVGATTDTDAMASFSSRGTTTDGRRKPEVSAPGQNIISCGTGANNYVSMSGTSMACPHVAGAVALLQGANPDWDFDDILGALAMYADHPTLSAADRNCGLETPGQDFPNNAFGDGRINVFDSLMGAKKH